MVVATPRNYRFYFGCMVPKGVQATVAQFALMSNGAESGGV